MSVPYPAVLAAIKTKDMLGLRRQFEGMAKSDLAEAGTGLTTKPP